MEQKRATGRAGERIAARYLEELGYRIVETNYRCALGEIDIIAEAAGELVFVEVRSRRSGRAGLPEESIGSRKGDRLRRLAEAYLQAHPDRPYRCRLDVVAVDVTPSGSGERVEHILNAITW